MVWLHFTLRLKVEGRKISFAVLASGGAWFIGWRGVVELATGLLRFLGVGKGTVDVFLSGGLP